MGNLRPERRRDRNNSGLPNWIRRLTGQQEEAVPVAPPAADQGPPTPIEILNRSLPSRREGVSKALSFVTENSVDSRSDYSSDPTGEIEGFLSRMQEKTLRLVTGFLDDNENGFIVRHMCASVIAGMAQRYRERSSDHGIDYTQLHNLMLLGEDFQRSVPGNYLDSAKASPNFSNIRDLNFRFNTLMDEIKPQNLSRTPDFMTLPEIEQRAARVALVIANVYYTGSDNSSRHRESELLECIDRHFDRRFEIVDVLDRHMDANPRLIDEVMTIEVRSMQDGWL